MVSNSAGGEPLPECHVQSQVALGKILPNRS